MPRWHLSRPRLAALTLPIWLACEPFSSSGETPTGAPSASGKTQAFSIDVLQVRDCPAPAHEKLSSDRKLLGVEVELVAKSERVPANYYYATLTDREGNAYRAGFFGCDPRLTGKPLDPGQRSKGFVNFELPRQLKDLSFTYAPKIGEAKGTPPSVTLPLGL